MHHWHPSIVLSTMQTQVPRRPRRFLLNTTLLARHSILAIFKRDKMFSLLYKLMLRIDNTI